MWTSPLWIAQAQYTSLDDGGGDMRRTRPGPSALMDLRVPDPIRAGPLLHVWEEPSACQSQPAC